MAKVTQETDKGADVKPGEGTSELHGKTIQ